jgi:hypothetical protein
MASRVLLAVLGCLLSMALVYVVLVGTHRLVMKLNQERTGEVALPHATGEGSNPSSPWAGTASTHRRPGAPRAR